MTTAQAAESRRGEAVDSHPAVARATILALAKLQGVRSNPKGEEEPGRIIHENRDPAELERIRAFEPDIDSWDFPFYGSVDATPLFIALVGEYTKRHGPAILDELVTDDPESVARFGGERMLRDALSHAVDWIEARLDKPEHRGFLCVQRANPVGIANQILEDSFDSVYDEHGVLPDHTKPYAPVAEQGYAWRALKVGAALLASTEPERAAALDTRADAFKKKVIDRFWQEDMGTFAQAVAFDVDSPEGRTFRTVASSPGQLLSTGILDDEPAKEDRLVDRLFQPDMLAGAGVRTKSTDAARFCEGGYHNGTVWPTISLEIGNALLERAGRVRDEATHEQHPARAAALLARSRRLVARGTDLEDRAIRACALFPYFPEFFRGDVDGNITLNTEVVKRTEPDGRVNTLEQPPQPQGWTATALDRALRRRGFDTTSGAPAEKASAPTRASVPVE